MPTYLIGHSESPFNEQDFCIVDADDEHEGMLKFVHHCVLTADELFRENVYSRSINASFASRFWFQTEDEDVYFESHMEPMIDDTEFKHRIRTFFSEQSAYAESYLKYYFQDTEDKRDAFPIDMLVFMYLQSGWTELSVIPLSDIV